MAITPEKASSSDAVVARSFTRETFPSATILASNLEQLLGSDDASLGCDVIALADGILEAISSTEFSELAHLLIKTCAHLFYIGRSKDAIELGRKLIRLAADSGDLHAERKLYNVIGANCVDIADFTAAMQYLQTALLLAKRIGDPTIEAACLANVATLLQEMGHYRQAISLCRQVLDSAGDSVGARGLKVQCASTGLFSAHRIGDNDAAAFFVAQGHMYLPYTFGEIGRAFFERDRTLYLIDSGRGEDAKSLIREAFASLGGTANKRVQTLLSISKSLCDWACGEKRLARAALHDLHSRSSESRLYHHWVLQALIKTYSDAGNSEEVTKGLGFARELVEYTTSVKKAKFYRQLANKRAGLVDGQENSFRDTDPFSVANDWLGATVITGPVEDDVAGYRPQLAKHEELTVIHEDMAKLRAMGIRRDIRTDAVDTAENWAVAAEFFDDETGQHCYRVGHMASLLASAIGMDETFCVRIEHAARLHDIGKIAVNELILLKPGALDAAEMAAMRLHTEVGAQILSGSDDPTLKMAAEVARHHHEWWNGAGYPTKAVGKSTPLSARICAYADVYDALTHARSYKKAWTHERALEEIRRLRGVQFDPDLMDPFIMVLERYRSDLAAHAIPGFVDMDANSLLASRKKLLETIGGESALA